MENITSLHIFDFDETLVRAPSYTAKKTSETEDLQFRDPYHFYDHPNSICEDIHHIQIISPVRDSLDRAKSKEGSYSILVTHRVKELENEVKMILHRRGIDFDAYFFLGRASEKIEIAHRYIQEFPNLTHVEIYEDSVQQIDKYQKYFRLHERIKLDTYIVDKSRMYHIGDIHLTNEQQIHLL